MRLLNVHLTTLFITLMLLAGVGSAAFAQGSQDETEITGVIVDQDGRPVPGANISLLDETEADTITGTASDSKGEFTLQHSAGNYVLLVSFISYQDVKQPVTLTSGQPLDVGKITLIPKQSELDEVLVEGERSYMQMNFDSRSFNVGDDITSLGGSALDVLDNVPSVSTDFEGNVSLRGNQGVQVLINDRPSSLLRSGTDALSTIPASMIEEIEIITNPSSRYAAEGTAGIINIKLVDNQELGLNGSVQSNVGYPQDHSVGTNLNYNKNSINWFLNLDFEYEREPENGRTFQSVNADTSFAFSESSDVTEQEVEGTVYFGADFFLPAEQILTISSRISIEDGEEDRERLFIDYLTGSDEIFRSVGSDWDILRQTNRRDIEDKRESDYSTRLQYEKKFPGDDHRLTVDADYEFGSESEDSRLFEVIEQGAADPQNQRTFANEDYREFRMDADYEVSVGTQGRFEAGMRLDYDWEDTDYRAEERVNNEWVDLEEGVGANDNFSYLENVNALYMNYNGGISDFTYQLGVRAENTRIRSELDQTGDESEQNYMNLFPSVFLSYSLNRKNSFQVSYSRRISRPWSGLLLPFTEITDSRSRRIGNPDLEPEFGNSYEAGYLRTWESGSILSSLYYRYRTGVVERVSTVGENGITTRRPINLATEEAWGIEFSGDQDLLDNLQLSGSLNLFQSNRKGEFQGDRVESESDSFTSRMRLRWGFLSSWNFQTNVFYRGPERTTQGREEASAFWGAGLSKDLLDGRATLSLNARDLLNSRQSDRDILEETSFTNSKYSWSSRSVRLNFRYNFSRGQ
ncbi:MAG: TonB-dependent receptor [Bacteroidetes bacterium]|jgi:outer membrane receptor protein involved in Fe transport|nr:TonB-dependent receptor [Bacteroidota bacterium]